MKEEIVTDIFLATLNFWELKGGEKISPELADIIELHHGVAYTRGVEVLSNALLDLFEKERTKRHPSNKHHDTLPIQYLKDFILKFKA